jgi:hypothetical protein
MVQRGHAVRVTTRSEQGRAEIEAIGAECWIGTPDRLATLRGSLHNVTILCWMLAGAHGSAEQLAALHGSRLEFFLGQAIDTTARGLIYDASPVAEAEPVAGAPAAVAGDAETRVTCQMLAEGRRIFDSLTRLNSMPAVVLEAPSEGDGGKGDPQERWVLAACAAADSLLGGGP